MAVRIRDIQEQLRLAEKCGSEALHACLAELQDDPRKGVQALLTQAEKRLERQQQLLAATAARYAYEQELSLGVPTLGIDEVGRGPLAGPLVVAAVALPPEPHVLGLNDSKQLAPAHRQALATRIAEIALAIGIAQIEPADIDRMGITASLRKAVNQAISASGFTPQCVLLDGNPLHAHPLEKTVIKGDSRVASIAAASIVAKVYRDHLMEVFDANYPVYGFKDNKGYGSKQHIEAIKRFGLSPLHRKSFCSHFMS